MTNIKPVHLPIRSIIVMVAMWIISQVPATAHEGMWLPHLLKNIEPTMQAMGMRMTAEDIYSVNKGSLKDAILHFGGGCTGSVISSTGLVLTNHHCGYGQIQSHSTLERNLLDDGFWASNHQEELPNPGLTVTFIRRIEDVTEWVLRDVTEDMRPEDRQAAIDKQIKAAASIISIEKDEDYFIRAFSYGNQYLLFVTLTYKDVRLVGTPPDAIGKFGADTDNWVWPRHTGDFALFRIYAGPDNRPAPYSPDNKPYIPERYLNVSLDGVEEGDFTMVFGFPGRTQQYLPASAVAMTMNDVNPPRIAIRDKALEYLGRAMRSDETVRIQYASKHAGIANAWKKWIGENLGLKETKALDRKLSFEKAFRERAAGHAAYSGILDTLNELVLAMTPLEKATQFHSEIFLRTVELFAPARSLYTLRQRFRDNGEKGFNETRDRILPGMERFYKNYNKTIDKVIFTALMEIYAKEGNPELAHPSIFTAGGESSIEALSFLLYSQTRLASYEEFLSLFDKESPEAVIEAIESDPAFAFYEAIQEHYIQHVSQPLAVLQHRFDAGMRTYVAARAELFPEVAYYPDANSTLRVTFGQVEGYQPEGKPRYEAHTWLSGVVEKYVPGDYEFDVPAKLLSLEATKDYGSYGVNGAMPVCFVGSNHTTGGNSGSPALDAWGNLIGLNFDRVWEGTMSDLNFDGRICRNIMVDARYILFIVDKFAGARHIVEEMTLVHPKRQ